MATFHALLSYKPKFANIIFHDICLAISIGSLLPAAFYIPRFSHPYVAQDKEYFTPNITEIHRKAITIVFCLNWHLRTIVNFVWNTKNV